MSDNKDVSELLDNIPDFLMNRDWYHRDVSSLFLDFSEPYRPPRWTLSHNGVSFANLGELHVITGKSGQGKTTLMSMLMAAILKGQYQGLKYELADKIPEPKVLYIDTEQGSDDTISIKNRVCWLAGIDYTKPCDRFKILRLRDVLDAEERWEDILKAIYEVRPNFCFLDGMLDIVNDYNDQQECQPIIRECMMTATRYDISMWCVLHENPTFEKMVGTLGSVLQRKVTEAFAVRKHVTSKEKKPKENRPAIYFTVEQLKARRYDQEDWDFEVVNNSDGWGIPVELDREDTAAHLQVEKVKYNSQEMERWFIERYSFVSWPATRTSIYKQVFEYFGITDEASQKEALQFALDCNLLEFEHDLHPGCTHKKIICNVQGLPPPRTHVPY